MAIDDQLLEKLLYENPAIRPTVTSLDLSESPSLDDLMLQSYNKPYSSPSTFGIIPEAPSSHGQPVSTTPQRIDPETIRRAFPNAAQQPQSQALPRDVDIRSRIASSNAAWGNVMRGLGRSGRNFRANPMAPEMARSAVINDYMQRKQAAENAQRQDAILELQKRKMALAERPKPVDPLERMGKVLGIKKQQQEIARGEREAKTADREESNKAMLADMMIASGKLVGVDKLSLMAMSLDNLESMAKTLGLSDLDLKKARAQGGISGGVGGTGISRSKSPELATAVQKALIADSEFINDPNEREAYQMLAGKDDLSKSEARVFEGIQKKTGDAKERLIKKADSWITKFNDPEKNVGQMFEAITELKKTLAKYPKVEGWNEVTSSIENLGDLGQWFIDLKNVNDPAARDIMNAIRRYKEAYARAASGAAIGQLEWTNFARQLGVGAFSNPESLRSGLDRAERVLKTAVTRAYDANVDPRLRKYDEWSTPVKPYLVPSKDQAQAVANKYRSK